LLERRDKLNYGKRYFVLALVLRIAYVDYTETAQATARKTEMNAIDWMESKATKATVDFISVSEIEADSAEEVGTYEVVTSVFSGFIPAHMIRAASKQSAAIVNTPTCNRVLLVNLKNGHAEFSKTEYRKVSA
jgi:hypothetical protein